MKALIQRVSRASVTVNNEAIGAIDAGLLVLLGVDRRDDKSKADQLLHKVLHYRIFNDDEGKMNLNVQQVGGHLLVVSQFTLSASTHKGMRPSFTSVAASEDARHLYEYFIQQTSQSVNVAMGQFGADMQVSLVNDGPVTFMLEV